MDVHHHHSHSGKKSFKEYFLEFLMIFVAVSLGFFAEQIREDFLENREAKEYTFSFYEDVKADTAAISQIIDFDLEKINRLALLAGRPDAEQIKTDSLINVFRYSNIYKPFQISERTIQQLVNAGGFRLLKKEDADSIARYIGSFNELQDYQSTTFQHTQDKVRDTYNSVINFDLNTVVNPLDDLSRTRNADVPLFITGDKFLINKFFNELLLYHRVTSGHRERLLQLKNQQTALLAYFKAKYGYE